MATWSRFTTNPGASRIFKEYLINPLGLVLRNGLLYLVCTFSGYEDIRQLLLHRMRQAEVVNEPCAVPDGFDLDGYIQDQGFDLARGRPDIPLRFRFRAVPASALYETPLSTDQVITPLADRQWVEVSATVADTDQLRWWLLGFGNQVEVLEPVALREEFCAIAQDMSRLYAASDSA